MKRKKILFFEREKSGIYYYRILTPAVHLDKNYQDYLDIEINDSLNIDDEEIALEYFSKFDLIQIHQFFHPNFDYNKKIFNFLKEKGVKVVLDIDDYWYLDKTHPLYKIYNENKFADVTIFSMMSADYITTTTERLRDEINLLVGKDNVVVLENSIDATIMNQFEDNNVEKNEVVVIGYLGSSIHLKDVELLDGLVNRLNADYQTKGKFKFLNVGWDIGNGSYELIFNKELLKELKERKLLNDRMLKQISKSKGDINSINNIPSDLLLKYKGVYYDYKQRPLDKEEIPYYHYEKIFTDNYRAIEDDEYLKYLKKYVNEKYIGKKSNYERIWTEPYNKYAKILDNVDVVIAPLVESHFNSMKSPLKMVEAWTRKLPVVCSDVAPYNDYGEHMLNCILVKNKPKFWFKEIKRIILDEKLRREIGNNLYEDFKDKFTLDIVNKKRFELYENIK